MKLKEDDFKKQKMIDLRGHLFQVVLGVCIIALSYLVLSSLIVALEQVEKGAVVVNYGHEQWKSMNEILFCRQEGKSLVEQTVGVEQMIKQLGQAGYVATDGELKINVENVDQIEKFYQQVQRGQDGNLSIFRVYDADGLIRLDFKLHNNNLLLVTNHLKWNEQGQVVIGVRQIAEKNRVACEKYIDPIGYQGNDLFLTNWQETDSKWPHFNDLYQYLYPLFGKTSFDENIYPYDVQTDTYHIPEAEFAKVISCYFQITDEKLKRMRKSEKYGKTQTILLP